TAVDTVVLCRLPDLTRRLPLPKQIRRHAQDRAAVVNAAVHEAGRWPGVEVLDLEAMPELRMREAWAVDRVHPSRDGHVAMAAAAAELLRTAGHDVPVITAPTLHERPTVRAQVCWLAAYGVPYLVANVSSFGRPALEGMWRRR